MWVRSIGDFCQGRFSRATTKWSQIALPKKLQDVKKGLSSYWSKRLSEYTSLQRYIAKGMTGPRVGCFWWINNFTIRIAIKHWDPMKMLFVHVFFWNSSRAHLLLYKISRSWIDRVGLGSGSSSYRLLDSGQGLREKTCEGCHSRYCKKKLVMVRHWH